MTIALRTLKSAIVGLLVFGILIFGPAGTFAYWQGWAFILTFSVCTNIIGLYLARTDPALLDRRLKVGPAAETRPVQKAIISLAFAAFAALFVVSTLDHRFEWSEVPAWASATSTTSGVSATAWFPACGDSERPAAGTAASSGAPSLVGLLR